MRTCINTLCLAVVLSISTVSLAAVDQEQAWAVPTFECLGLYYPCATEQGDCEVQYRQAGEKSCRKALPLVCDFRQQQYRGSLVGNTLL